MNGALGHAGVLLAFLGAVCGAITLILGLLRGKQQLIRQGPAYMWMLIAGVGLAVFAMERALITHDFSLSYVATNNSRETPLLFTISGMWAALQGSILLWGLILVLYVGSMVWHFRSRRSDPVVAWATAVCFIVTAFFFGLMLGPANPFKATGGVVPADGPGPNPLLQNHPLMAFHPPVLYAGYVGFTIPFAFGIAALITGRVGEGWLVEVRRWTLLAWGFLSAGIVLGSWWSYQVLGWGGYWAWDPVENASLLPWLTATAYLHSVMVQERRGMLRIWNLSLLCSTFALTILGTFLTRSGVLDSVHSFSDSPLGPALITAFGVVVAVTCGLIFWRGDRLGSPGTITSPLSREASFLANNVLFAAFAFVVLLGTVFPLITEALNNDQISIGAPYFNTMTRPLGLLLLFLMAIAPTLTWRGASRELMQERLLVPAACAVVAMAVSLVLGAHGLWSLLGFGLGAFVAASSGRQIWLSVRRTGWRGFTGRTGGGMIAHIGFAIMAVAFTASQAYSTHGEFQMQPGQTATIAGHHVTFKGLRVVKYSNRTSTIADLRIDGGKTYSPSLSAYPNSNDAIGTPSVQSLPKEDVYLTLVRTPVNAGDPAVIGVIVEPMVGWLWTGGGVIALGALLARVKVRPAGRSRLPRKTTVPADVLDANGHITEKEPVLT